MNILPALRGLTLCLAGSLWSLALGGDDHRLVNQLKDHPSPYLAMHGDDPVHWQRWSSETLEKARTLNRPILISSGYFACHWCHVMQRESFRDPAVADFLNRYFIPVKIDRELNPALDAHLIEFVELVRGQSGWPLNVLLTPDGYPVLGLVYAPRDRFHRLLKQFHSQWMENEAQLRQTARDAMAEWRQLRETGARGAPAGGAVAGRFVAEAGRIADQLAGGFGQQNKFPMVAQLQALLFLRRQGEAAELDEFIRLTLDSMAGQGLHDNLGGGFFRYVTDPGWQVPHYEKMLYDNAQLAALYLDAADLYRSTDYTTLGLATVDFMLQEMSTAEGAFIGSFSAVDSQGREGFYYLWSTETLKKSLSPTEFKAVQAAWFDGHSADSEYGRLPRWQGSRDAVAAGLGWPRVRLDAVLATARPKMLAARGTRELLPDRKVLAAWNGLALSALAKAYAASGDKVYALSAARLSAYLATKLWDGKQLLRAREADEVLSAATLEDYALVAKGLWDWSEVAGGGQSDASALAAELVRQAWRRYFSDGRWRQDDAPLIPMLDGKPALADGALPSASAVISRLSAVHPLLSGDETVQKQLSDHLQQVRGRLGDSLFWYAGYVEPLFDAQQ